MSFVKKHKIIVISAVAIVAAVIAIILIAFAIYNSNHSLNCGLSKNDDGSVKLNVSLDQLKEKNIELGDEVNIKLSCGYSTKETPLLNGDYLNPGQHLITINSDGSQITYKLQNHNNLYNLANIKDGDTANITLNKKSSYTYLNNAFQMPLKEDANNIRPLKGGKIKGLGFFRGSDPHAQNQDQFVINYYFKSLNIENIVYLDEQKDNINCMELDVLYCNYMIIDTLRDLCKNNDRTYFYSANEDFTGYFCAIIEGLAGASYDEIVNDYMETYKNLYGITKKDYPNEYEAVKKYHIDWFLRKLIKTTPTYDLSKCDYSYAIEMYLRSQGISSEELEQIKSRICI